MSGNNNNTNDGIIWMIQSLYEGLVVPNKFLFSLIVCYLIYRYLFLRILFFIGFRNAKKIDLWIFAILDRLEKKYPTVTFLQRFIRAYRLKFPMDKGRRAYAEFDLRKKYSRRVRLRKIKQKISRIKNKTRFLIVYIYKYRLIRYK